MVMYIGVMLMFFGVCYINCLGVYLCVVVVVVICVCIVVFVGDCVVCLLCSGMLVKLLIMGVLVVI